MQLEWKKRGGTLYVEPAGELDQHSADDLRRRLNALIEDGSVTRVVYNMNKVCCMDSSGIGVLLGRYALLSARGGSMDVVNASRSMERILRMAGVYKLCTKEEDRNEE